MHKFIGVFVLGLIGVVALAFFPFSMILMVIYALGKFIQLCMELD